MKSIDLGKTIKAAKKKKVTPLMEQYFNTKSKYPDAILLFRVGDFYETFSKDAITASKVLGIILTKRNNGGEDIELAGFPYHSLNIYLPKLVRAGFRVAICEQLEKPSKEKKIVKRGVTEVITPGIAIDESILENSKNNYLCALHYSGDKCGLAFLDISTGEFHVSEGSEELIDKLVQAFKPSEIIYSRSKAKVFEKQFGTKQYSYKLDEWIFTYDYGREQLIQHFEVQNLKGFGIDKLEFAQIAGGVILHYLGATENKQLEHINTIQRIQSEEFVWLDRFSIRNLELISSPHDDGIPLIDILDKSISPMGSRLMRKWVTMPLVNLHQINQRHQIVQYFIDEINFTTEIENHINQIGDLERLISKVSLAKISPRELLQLKKALFALMPIQQLLSNSKNEALILLADSLHLCETARDRIKKEIKDEAPVALNKGHVIKDGVSDSLDEYRHIVKNSKALLVEIQEKESEATGIKNLKIGFNNVFGYYLEVTNKYKNQGLVPDYWVRKQTLTGSERYITDELKKLETKILEAEDKISNLESEIYEELVNSLRPFIQPIQHNATVIAQLDCLLSFARSATKNNYCQPEMSMDLSLDIKKGRHPVIEHQLGIDTSYVPNDVYLDNEEQQIIMITGPNMSGKSAVLRQTALICLMAQMGSFVPAETAKLGVVDKLFTRVGASDNISSGESTFMVEMNETAAIMNNISERSLILLDEIGRGTSTYDGISIAWSIAEYLHSNSTAKPKTLFATHYHELNELAGHFERIKNFNISTKEVSNKVIFLRKLIPGGSKHSFGIHVAKMAGMPRSILERASKILHQLEQKVIDSDQPSTIPVSQNPEDNAHFQLSIFETVDETAGKLKSAIQDLELNAMTPIDCMMKLNELKKLIEEEK